MSCCDCQSLKITLHATWTDNGDDFDSLETLYDGERPGWYLLEGASEAGSAWTLGANGALLARGNNTDIPGDVGYGMTIQFQSIHYPVPARVVFAAVHYDEFHNELSRSDTEIELPGIDMIPPEEASFTPPGNNESIEAEDFRLYVGNLSGL